MEAHQKVAAMTHRGSERLAIPAETGDLIEPGLLGDAGIVGDPMSDGVVGQRADQLIARAAPLGRSLMPVETEARDFPNVRPGWDNAGTKMRIEMPQYVLALRAQQSRGCAMDVVGAK